MDNFLKRPGHNLSLYIFYLNLKFREKYTQLHVTYNCNSSAKILIHNSTEYI